jgi:hypothetical protein
VAGACAGADLGRAVPQENCGLPIRIVDATVINGPGAAVAVQWRAHVLVSAVSGRIRSVQLTGDEGGEKLSRYPIQEGELILGDRAYGTARGLYAIHQQRARVIVRFTPATLRTCDSKRRRIDLREYEDQVPALGAAEFPVLIPVPPPPTRSHKPWLLAKAIAWIPARVVAARTRSGEVIWLLTNLPHVHSPVGRDGSISLALANRTALQAPQVSAPSRHLAISSRADGKSLDVGTFPSRGSCRAVGGPARNTFPLGIRNPSPPVAQN